MKFLCGNCKAKYQIADEKVTGRTLRMKCRRCDHDILIDGHSMPAPASHPPAAQGTGNVRRGGVSVIPGPGRSGGSGAHIQPVPPRGPGIPAPPARASTRPKPPSALSADFRRHVAAPPEVPQRTAPYDLWHVAIQDVPVGPMTRDELGRKVDAGAVTADSLCWREGMDDWRPLGELPELAALMRRPRDGRSMRPARSRAPALGAPQGARSSLMPMEAEEFGDDEGSEPTRIADLSGPNSPLSAAMAGAAMRSAPGSSSSPKILVAPPMPAAAPAPVPVDPSPSVARASKGNQGLTTGIAVGLLFGILLVGGPMLYRNTWGTPAPAPVVETKPAETAPKPAELATKDIVEVPTQPEAPVDTAVKPDPKGAGKTKTDPGKAPAQPKDTMTAEQRALLERMGAGGDMGKIGSGTKPPREAVNSGPALTGAQLSAVVQNNKTQLQRCYESALRATGGQQQETIKVKVSVVVGESGSVKSTSTQGTGLGQMNECLKQSVKRWRFPASSGESEFEFPLVFQPGA
jgi:predicted Zn finger-like uncharacterized protein